MVTLIISKYHLENRITSRETKRIQDLYFTLLFLFIYFLNIWYLFQPSVTHSQQLSARIRQTASTLN